MLGFSTNQLAILFLVLLLGWLLGLISRSGKKWRIAYEAERDARIEDGRVHAEAVAVRDARIAELERGRPAAIAPAAVSSGHSPATLDLTRDDLARISGVGPAGEARLNEEDIYRYADLADLSADQTAALEDKLGADRGYIDQERWREQAALLRDGKLDEHRATYG